MKKILTLGINGFIGHHLSRRILKTTDWEVCSMGIQTERLGDLVSHPHMHLPEGDVTTNKGWVEYRVKKCDVILPLITIAMPPAYVKDPLCVFELDLEANLSIVRSTIKCGKYLALPSTSEAYGIYSDPEFDPKVSPLIYGPISKPRWIYVCSKQLVDRAIWDYSMEGLNFTLPHLFDWVDPGLDLTYTLKEGSSRVVTQFLGHIMHGENIELVDGGSRKRAFTYIGGGIDALVHIIASESGVVLGRIYNIGNPSSDYSTHELANMVLEQAANIDEYRDTAGQVQLVETISGAYYGSDYQDVQSRMPKIANIMEGLGQELTTVMKDAPANIFEAYRTHVAEVRGLVKDSNSNK